MPNVDILSFPVKGGDCFLVSIYEKKKINILIDSGYKGTAKEVIKKLKALKKEGEKINLFIITHIDRDHIGGAIKILEGNDKNKIVEIEEFWHNGFAKIYNVDEYVEADYESRLSLQAIIMENTPNDSDMDEEGTDVGFEEANSFEDLLGSQGYVLNKSFGGKAITASMSKKLEVAEDVEFIILSPTSKEFENLRDAWEETLSYVDYDSDKRNVLLMMKAFEFFNIEQDQDQEDYDYDAGTDDVYEANIKNLAKIKCKLDNKLQNKSSIAFILRVGKKKLLFLGDANPEIVKNQLEKLQKKDHSFKYFDFVKVSHHGSKKNISNELLEIINCKKFLISTDGTHDLPDKEAIAKILLRANNTDTELYFNYPLNSYLPELKEIILQGEKMKIVKPFFGDGKKPVKVEV
jgi:metal-dependent hydrolase (beta-lactamase superfamily II)